MLAVNKKNCILVTYPGEAFTADVAIFNAALLSLRGLEGLKQSPSKRLDE